ncbi:MAG: bifunctional adenosylcobinamide kinase/adenosylcobinamide-phosphate guanylyltransferase [Pseudomonadota bacterium]
MSLERKKPSVLILGGARSGKSRHASELALAASNAPLLLATAQALDEEMAERILIHQNERSDKWETVECPVEIVEALRQIPDAQTVVVDCLTLWLSNLLHNDLDWMKASDALCNFVAASPQHLIFVSNEVGLGLVPQTPLGRIFRDAQGHLNQRLAGVVDEVYFLAAGLPLQLK